MSAQESPAKTTSAAKPRNPIERAVVRGGIVVLLIVVGIEFVGYRAQMSAMSALREKIQAADTTNNPLKSRDVQTLMGRKPSRIENVTSLNLSNNAKNIEVYDWFTFNPVNKRELCVYYGVGDREEADVINVTTGEDQSTINVFGGPGIPSSAATPSSPKTEGITVEQSMRLRRERDEGRRREKVEKAAESDAPKETGNVETESTLPTEKQ